MSRTKHSFKAPGYEYWGTRGYPSCRMAVPGRTSKIATHRAERRLFKRHCADGIGEIDLGPPLVSGGKRQPV